MTGEITLRGRVLPIGGLKEKMLAARRAGMKTFILPEKNRKDLADVPANVARQLELVFVDEMGQVLSTALVDWRWGPAKKPGRVARRPKLASVAAAQQSHASRSAL